MWRYPSGLSKSIMTDTPMLTGTAIYSLLSIIHQFRFQRSILFYVMQLKIDKPVSSHIFRHTHISKLAELGVPMYVIQQRVGHSNSRVTQEIYTHVTHEAIVKNRDQLENL